MSYKNANDVLPKKLIKEIQTYVNGINLYIPGVIKKETSDSDYRREIKERNKQIWNSYQAGNTVSELASKFFLSEKSIYRILRQMKQ